MSMSRFGDKGQYQPVIILILLLTLSTSFIYFSLRTNKDISAEKESYHAFYTKRVFHTVLNKKVDNRDHTLLQLTGEYLCPRDGDEDCNLGYIEFKNSIRSTLNETLPDKYNYYLEGNSSDSKCSFGAPKMNKTYVERASVIQFEGLGYNDCNYTLKFAIWLKK